MSDLVKVKRALLSVSDKQGMVEFARTLAAHGVELVSTGGTAKVLRDGGLKVTPIEDVTRFPEMMGGRLKTLHPMVHGGLLAVRDDAEHVEAMRTHGIEAIDLVCVNLYPFEATIAKAGATRQDAIENIDIGGPSMVRSAAKNHEYVAVVTSAAQYAEVMAELNASGGATSRATRRLLATRAFAMTAAYDGAIAKYLIAEEGAAGEAPGALGSGLAGDDGGASAPAVFELHATLAQTLRYGENPHQAAAVYRDGDAGVLSVIPGDAPGQTRQIHGKELSYNNLADGSAALELAVALAELARFERGAACVVKHANPCGAALGGAGATARDVINAALAGDPVAAFGGILASSLEIDEAAAERLCAKETFLEVIVAPGFTAGALAMLKARSVNVRLLATGPLAGRAAPRRMARTIPGGVLVQDRDRMAPTPGAWTRAAGPEAKAEMLEAAAAVEVMVRAMSSNAIAIGGIDGSCVRLFGGGIGQVDRVTACRLAVEKARAFAGSLLSAGAGAADAGAGGGGGEGGGGAIAVSDAFFPFDDGARVLVDAGVKLIVHPGGSKRDADTFALCEGAGVTCMITGVRRFRH